MSVRIIDEHDVRRLLPMGECIEVMAEALADPTVWLQRELVHACSGRRPGGST